MDVNLDTSDRNISTSTFTDSKFNYDFSTIQGADAEISFYNQENFALQCYTEVVERYLQKKCPKLMNMGDLVSGVGIKPSLATKLSNTTSSQASSYLTSPRSTGKRPSMLPNVRINTMAKTNIIDRETEDNRISIAKKQNLFVWAKFEMTIESENLQSDLAELEEKKMLLEDFLRRQSNYVKENVIYVKFKTFLEGDLENEGRKWLIMRMKRKTAEMDYKQLQIHQGQTLELCESVHAIDVQRLEIENQRLAENFEIETKHLKDLKTAANKKGHDINLISSKIYDTESALKNVILKKIQVEKKVKYFQGQESDVVRKLKVADSLQANLKQLYDEYKAPDVVSYMELETAFTQLKKDEEMWRKRVRNVRQSLTNQAGVRVRPATSTTTYILK